MKHKKKQCLIKVYIDYSWLNEILRKAGFKATTENRHELLNLMKGNCYMNTSGFDISY